VVRSALVGGTEYSWMNGTYCCLIPGELGIKVRDPYYMRIAVSVKADLYAPDIPITPFAVVIRTSLEDGLFDSYYLVQDLGDVGDVDDSSFLRRNPALLPQLKRLEEHLVAHGYHEDAGQRYHSFGYAPNGVVIHDLDCKTMDNWSSIMTGSRWGRGPFAHLKDIYRQLAELSLDIYQL